MRRVRLTLEYDGGSFRGWQRQPTEDATVQGALERAFAALPGEHGPVLAAGRTDAGVHALAMVAHCDTSSGIPDEKLRLALNAHLPAEVAVLDLSTADPGFESQYDCCYRRYCYRLRVVRGDPRGVALDRGRVLAVHRRLDLPAMQAACRHLPGRRDFASFATQETRATLKTLHLCELRAEAGELRLHVAADGFLRGMVRGLVGTLLWVGKGKLGPDDLPSILGARDRRRSGHNAPPHGLYFVEAGYVPWDPLHSERVAEARLDGVPSL